MFWRSVDGGELGYLPESWLQKWPTTCLGQFIRESELHDPTLEIDRRFSSIVVEISIDSNIDPGFRFVVSLGKMLFTISNRNLRAIGFKSIDKTPVIVFANRLAVAHLSDCSAVLGQSFHTFQTDCSQRIWSRLRIWPHKSVTDISEMPESKASSCLHIIQACLAQAYPPNLWDLTYPEYEAFLPPSFRWID
jgi:hypothetical protein